LPGGSGSQIPTFEEMGINLSTLISPEPSPSDDSPTLPPMQSAKLKVTAYKNLKEKVKARRYSKGISSVVLLFYCLLEQFCEV
jgi:hypothetical protein